MRVRGTITRPLPLVFDRVDTSADGRPEDAGSDLELARLPIGEFLAWAVQRDLDSDELGERWPGHVKALRARRISGAQLLEECCEDTLSSEALSSLGTRFARDYYASSYREDFAQLGGAAHPSPGHRPDPRETSRMVRDLLDRRLAEWKRGKGLR